MEITRQTIEAAARLFIQARADARAIEARLNDFNDGMIYTSCSINPQLQIGTEVFDEAVKQLGIEYQKNDDWSDRYPELGEKSFSIEVDGQTVTIIALYNKEVKHD